MLLHVTNINQNSQGVFKIIMSFVSRSLFVYKYKYINTKRWQATKVFEIFCELLCTIIDCIDYVTGIAHGGILRVASMLYKMA